jgi:Haloacid dehalogenase-like hydrolase
MLEPHQDKAIRRAAVAATLPGSLDAISRIQAAGIPLKFITNTTRRPRRRIAGDLAGMGRRAALDDIYTPARYVSISRTSSLTEAKLRARITSPVKSAKKDFSPIRRSPRKSSGFR